MVLSIMMGIRPLRPPMAPDEAAALSPLVLAYVGDAVYELVIRTSLLSGPMPVDRLHRQSVAWVSARGQERVWQHIQDQLEPGEQEIARRARNAKSAAPKTASVASYRRATALEALVGYLYLTGRVGRIEALLKPALERLWEDLGEEGSVHGESGRES